MKEGMELIMDGEVGKVGKGTCVIRIPADTAKVMGIKPGSRVLCYKDGTRLIYEFPGGEAPKVEGEKPEEF